MSYQRLSHSTWDCTYHLVCIPKYRKKKLYGHIRRFLGPVFHELAGQKRCQILEGHMCQDHVHMLIKIPPKYAVSDIIGSLKGKSAIAVARQFGGRKRNFGGEKFWARATRYQRLALRKTLFEIISAIKRILIRRDMMTKFNRTKKRRILNRGMMVGFRMN